MEEEKLAFSAREKIALWVLLLILKVVKPMRWEADYKEEITKVRDLLA